MELLRLDWQVWLQSLGTLLIFALFALAVYYIFHSAAKRVTRRTHSVTDDSLIRHTHRPALLIVPALAVFVALPLTELPADVTQFLRHAVSLILIAAVAWLTISLTDVVRDLVSERYRLDVADNLEARQVHTRIRVLRRVVVVVVSFLSLSLMLMTFPSIRQVGTTLFASAGIIGLVAGMAARPALSNLIAGVQIAVTRPIRIDDVVIVENEWGWIEEIGTTFVVVRVWDLRRLVVPLSYFIDHPFQNWTRQTADILGTVFVYTDYTVPVEEVRQELHRILKASGMWDGKVWGMQVTNTTDRAVELRALMSAPDSGKAWNLRCHVREKLIEYLQRCYPESLPRARAELHRLPEGAEA